MPPGVVVAKRRKRLPKLSKLGGVPPASSSMFQSSLYYKDNFTLPQMRALDTVQSALAKDALSQNLKAALSDSKAARNADSPRSPKNVKNASLAPIDGPEAQAPSPRAQASRPPCLDSLTAGKTKLRTLFGEIDKKGTGCVTHRSVLFTLHQRLHEEFGDTDGVRQASSWLREAAKQLDVENTGIMDWKAFLDFTRRAEIFLEHASQKETDNELDTVKNALKDQQEELKNLGSSNVEDKNLEIHSEIRKSVGRDNEARFNSNRRAGSPEVIE